MKAIDQKFNIICSYIVNVRSACATCDPVCLGCSGWGWGLNTAKTYFKIFLQTLARIINFSLEAKILIIKCHTKKAMAWKF